MQSIQHVTLDNGLHLITEHVPDRSEEHTSELQSRRNLVCRLLLEKKKKKEQNKMHKIGCSSE